VNGVTRVLSFSSGTRAPGLYVRHGMTDSKRRFKMGGVTIKRNGVSRVLCVPRVLSVTLLPCPAKDLLDTANDDEHIELPGN